MQPNPEVPLSTPHRQLDIEDYIDIARRRKSWILGPTFAGLVIGVMTAFIWPDRFISAGAIRVVPPQVPAKLVPTNISEQISQRINAMYQGITSRPNMTNLITSMNLYPSERKRKPLEDVIEDMRKDIIMSPMRGITRFNPRAQDTGVAFSIAFRYRDRKKAQEVTRDLISKFIDESLRSRSAQSVSTTEFLKDQLAASKKDLDDAEKKILEFRQKNPAETAETEEQLLARIGSLENTAQSLNLAISRSNQEKLQLESALRGVREQAVTVIPATPEQAAVQGRNERLVELDREIAKLEGSLSILREQYKDDYPEVQRLLGVLASRRQQREQLVTNEEANKAAQTLPAGQPRTPVPDPQQMREMRDYSGRMALVQGQIQAKDQQIEDLTRQLNDIRRRILSYQTKIDASPAVRQAYDQMIRDRDMARGRYENMVLKLQESSLASDLESRRQGETLELLEDANLPIEPYAPQRLPIILGGLGLGLVLGFVLVAVREIKDTSLKNLKDVRAYTKLAVLGSIPLLESDLVVRRRRRLSLVAWTAAFLIGVILMSGSVYYWFSTRV